MREYLIGIPEDLLKKWAEELIKIESSIATQVATEITEYINLKVKKP